MDEEKEYDFKVNSKRNQEIHILLSYMDDKYPNPVHVTSYLKGKYDRDHAEAEEYIKELMHEECIDHRFDNYEDRYLYVITKFGREVENKGGWVEYIKRKCHDDKRLKKEDKLRRQKLEWDASISKFLFKTRWLPLIISIISLPVAFYAAFYH